MAPVRVVTLFSLIVVWLISGQTVSASGSRGAVHTPRNFPPVKTVPKPKMKPAPSGTRIAGHYSFVVTTTADLPSCPPDRSTGVSLRCAIVAANSSPHNSAVAIKFAIPSSDPGCTGTPTVCVIRPTSDLPPVTQSLVTIDGYSQPGAHPNGLTAGDNAVLTIQLDGSSGTSPNSVLLFYGNGETVKGLSITNWHSTPYAVSAIYLALGSNNLVTGNFLGVSPSGVAAGNDYGVDDGGNYDVIGGTTPVARNLISANLYDGVRDYGGLFGSVQGNLIGTNPSGTAAMGNGIGIFTQEGATIGGTVPGAGNVVSGNLGAGIGTGTNSATIINNLIGTSADGTKALGNGSHGISGEGESYKVTIKRNIIAGNAGNGISSGQGGRAVMQGNFIGVNKQGVALPNGQNGIFLHDDEAGDTIGGISPRAGNTIADNLQSGILLGNNPDDNVQGIRIARNSMYGNGNLGIILNGLAPAACANPPPGSTYVNGATPCPVIQTAMGSQATGTACPNCTVELFTAVALPSDHGHGEGKTFLGSAVSDGTGAWIISGLTLASGQSLTATETTTLPYPETGEFSANFTVTGAR